MSKTSKLQQRNLNDAFIVLSDDDENMPSDVSTISDTASFRERTKMDSIEYSSYSTDYLMRNFNLQSPKGLSPKNKSLSEQQKNLKRSGSLSTCSRSKHISKNVCFNKVRRSLELKNSPLVDISNTETPKLTATSIRRMGNNSRRLTPKTLKAVQKSEKEFSVEHNTPRSCPQKRNEGWNSTPRKNIHIKVPGNFKQRSSQACSKLVSWERMKPNQTGNQKNAENGSTTNSSEENIKPMIASQTSTIATDPPCCSYVPSTSEVVNEVTEPSETQEISQNNLSASEQIHDFTTDTYFNRLGNVLSKVCNGQDFLNPYSKTKQMYYDRKKVDLDEIERETRNKILYDKPRREVERKILNNAYSIENQKNLCSVKSQNAIGNEYLSDLSESGGHRYCEIKENSELKTPETQLEAEFCRRKTTSEFHRRKPPEIPVAAEYNTVELQKTPIVAELNEVKTPETSVAAEPNKVKTPETPLTALVNKNLSEFCNSDMENWTTLSPKTNSH